MTHYIYNELIDLSTPRLSLMCSCWLLAIGCWLLASSASALGWENSTLARYNNLEPDIYRNCAVSGKSDFHVDISKSPRGE